MYVLFSNYSSSPERQNSILRALITQNVCLSTAGPLLRRLLGSRPAFCQSNRSPHEKNIYVDSNNVIILEIPMMLVYSSCGRVCTDANLTLREFNTPGRILAVSVGCAGTNFGRFVVPRVVLPRDDMDGCKKVGGQKCCVQGSEQGRFSRVYTVVCSSPARTSK